MCPLCLCAALKVRSSPHRCVYKRADSLHSRHPLSLSIWQVAMETVKVNNGTVFRLPWAEVSTDSSVATATVVTECGSRCSVLVFTKTFPHMKDDVIDEVN